MQGTNLQKILGKLHVYRQLARIQSCVKATCSHIECQFHFQTASQDGHAINLTPLSNIPGAKIKRYLGNVSFFLIRETSNLREVGGLNSFIQVSAIEFPRQKKIISE